VSLSKIDDRVIAVGKKRRDEEVFHLPWLKTELVGRENLHDVPELLLQMRLKGIKEAVISKVVIRDELTGKTWEGELVLRAEDEALIIRCEDPSYKEALDWYWENYEEAVRQYRKMRRQKRKQKGGGGDVGF